MTWCRRLLAVLLLAVFTLVTDPVAVPHAGGQEPPPVEEKEDLTRVLPVFDPGAHTQPITALGFTKDNKKLVTVGEDFTIQTWNTATGERLDILRLPGYGREKGFAPAQWKVAAVAPDGQRVALGGESKSIALEETKGVAQTRLLLVDLARKQLLRVSLPGIGPVDVVRFSPDGETLAVGLSKGVAKTQLFVIGGLTQRIAKANQVLSTADCTVLKTAHKKEIGALAFAPDGKRLVAGDDGRLTLWDIGSGAGPKVSLQKEVAAEGETTSLDWSPDGKQFVRTATGGGRTGERALELWNADGTRAKLWKVTDMPNVFARFGQIYTARYLNATTVYFVGNGFIEKNAGNGSLAGTLDTTTGAIQRVSATLDGLVASPTGAASADGKLVALTVTGNTEVLLGPPQAGSERVACGNRTPFPAHVGWAKNPAGPGFAWTTEHHNQKTRYSAEILRFGFDLTKVEPIGAIRGGDYDPARLKHGAWTLDLSLGKEEKDDDAKGRALLKQGDKTLGAFGAVKGKGHTLVPNGDNPPLVAFRGGIISGAFAQIHRSDGTRLARLLPDWGYTPDLAASPDGRFLIATTGTARLLVYRTDGSPHPLLSFAQLNGEWVCWTPEGYYAASPGGEKLFGWAVHNGPNEFVTFHPAEKFAKQFRRPDVIKLAIEKGSVKAALAALNTKPAEIEPLLPPSVKLDLVEQRGALVKVKATATAGAKDRPVQALRLLLDGRPLANGAGLWTAAPGKAAEDVFEVAVPAGLHELKVLARTDDGSAVSAALPVRGPRAPESQQTLHRVCVGVDDYDDAGLKLTAATRDARDLFAALERDCVGKDNRFGTAQGELILDKEATRGRVLEALAKVSATAKPGDLVVLFFAGHGVKKEEDYYLLTREADVTKALANKSLSGADLRKALAEIECPVLLILDACHSANAVRNFRPATDDLSRGLADERVGVTVLAAAMAHEVAGATAENGHFTAGLLKGLRAGVGVPYDPYERQLYVHHLYAVVFSEVRRATGGKQNPFLNMPWTAPPVAVRDVPER